MLRIAVLFALISFAPVSAFAGDYVLPVKSLEAWGLDMSKKKSCNVDGYDFYLVGFSKKGAFAYFSYTDEDALMMWRLVIVNLVNDKHLEEVTLEDGEGDMTALAQFTESSKKKEILAALEKYGIDPHQEQRQVTFPWEHNGDVFDLKMTTTKREEDDTEATLEFVNRRRGSKRIATVSGFRCCDELVTFRSPFEPRLAVVTLVGRMGFEASVVCDVQIAGASLTRGFKKKK